MKKNYLAIILAILATTVAGGCSEIGEPQPVYEMFNCRELADEYTLQNSRVRQVTDIEIIRESRDELLCTGRADIELAADHEVRIQVQRLESGRVTWSVKARKKRTSKEGPEDPSCKPETQRAKLVNQPALATPSAASTSRDRQAASPPCHDAGPPEPASAPRDLRGQRQKTPRQVQAD